MKSLLLSTSIAASLLFSSVISAENISAAQQKQLSEIAVLLEQNPEIIEGLHKNLTKYVEGQGSISSTLKQNHDYLYNNPMHSYFGSEAPELTVINFTDYNCSYCKRLESGLVKMIKKYPEIRVVNIDLPFQQRMIPGLDTNTAWYALNVWENNRPAFSEVHRLMMAKPSRHDRKSIMTIAEMTGTEAALTANEMKKKMVKKNEIIFSQLGLRGTPALIIGNEIIPGAIPQAQLDKLIQAQLK
ncbi:MAG: protein-disulfide isomerase [Psychromonas sp.]|jgi:protein-disulfide isomerase|uniref:DsbA family protein n=1 Tax=Psychromonas sp. TaxID=1884585 RepID=UPI0039E6AB37